MYSLSGLILENKGIHVLQWKKDNDTYWHNTNDTITSFSKPMALGMLHFPKEHVAFKVLTENKVFYFLNRALHAGTPCNKRLK